MMMIMVVVVVGFSLVLDYSRFGGGLFVPFCPPKPLPALGAPRFTGIHQTPSLFQEIIQLIN
jgi:hypothetical protein